MLLLPTSALQLTAVPWTPALLLRCLWADAWALAKPGSGLSVRPLCEWQTAAKGRAKLSFSSGNCLEIRQKVPELGRR